MNITIPLRTVSALNVRESWWARSRRVKSERTQTFIALLQAKVPRKLPALVQLTRIAPRLLDDDNLRGALKGVRDQIAAYFKVNDNDPRICWHYYQRKGKPKEYAVEIAMSGNP